MEQGDKIAAEFRARFDDYFRALDDWGQAYGRFYRILLPGQVSADLQPQYLRFEECKRALKRCMPQAQVLCHRYRIRENWSGLLRVELQTITPQNGAASPIGRSERSNAMAALSELELAVLSGESSPEPAPQRKRGLVDMILRLF